MNINSQEIIQRRLKINFCPAFVKPSDYWNHQKQEQLQKKSWKIFILVDLIIICLFLGGILFLTKDLVTQIFLGVFALFCVGNLIRIIFSSNQKIWWGFLLCIALLSTVCIIFLSIFFNNLFVLILLFFSINHLIALIRSRRLLI